MPIPWYAKIVAKVVLSRLPIAHRTWQRLGLFRAGAMDAPAYALDIVQSHLAAAGLAGRRDFTMLELGPGDGLLSALYGRALGASRVWLIDAHDLASRDLAALHRANALLAERGLPPVDLRGVSRPEEAMERLQATYLTEGLASLRQVPDRSADLVFSQAVLEHVREREFAATLAEMRRVLKEGGVASHVVDFRDHLQDSLNNLRFSDRLWESDFMAGSGFYTNRIPWPWMREAFTAAGFAVEVLHLRRWPGSLPLPQSSLAHRFRAMPPEDLMVSGAHVLLRT